MQFYTNVVRHRNRIHHFYYRNGRKHHIIETFDPTLSVVCNEETGWTTYMGENVREIHFDSINLFNDYVKNFSATIALHGNIDPIYQYISRRYEGKMSHDASCIRTLFIDIEVNSEEGFPYPYEARWPIVSISIKDSKTGYVYALGLKEYDPKAISIDVNAKHIFYKKCRDEESLLESLIAIIEKTQPDVMIGWNSSGFDFPYIINRVENVLGEEHKHRLSPVGGVRCNHRTIKDKIVYYCSIPGIALLDYMDMYKKYLPGERESFSLDAISEYELGANKIDYTEYDNLRTLWAKNHQKFIDYNIMDVELIDLLDRKLGLLALHFTIAYKAKCNFADAMSPVKTWDCYIYNVLLERNIVVPPHKNLEKEKYPGAYVHDPKPGVKGWLASFDLNSLYPHIKMQWNISPETIINGFTSNVNQMEIDSRFFTKDIDVADGFVLAGNGQYFSKEKEGIIPSILKEIYAERSAVKRKMLDLKQVYEDTHDESLSAQIATMDNIQLALKIMMNSEYGATGSKYFRYYDTRLASAVTMSGQLAINWARRAINAHFREAYGIEEAVCYVDTDSLYVHMDSVVEGFQKKKPASTKTEIVDHIDEFCVNEIEPLLEACYKDLAKYIGAVENKMVMKREKIAERGLWVAKKRYATLVWDDEGVRYNEPKLKVTGLEIVRSSTPKAVKPYIRQAVVELMKNPDTIADYVRKFRRQFNELSPEQIAFPRSVNGLKKYRDDNTIYRKGCPIGPRAALIYNYVIRNEELEDQYPMIEEGEKVKFLYMKQPNYFANSNVMGFVKRFPCPERFKDYVDYKLQFDKAVKKVIVNLANAANVQFDEIKKVSLDALFG